MKLECQSERYAPTGNISGRGIERSLGTPTLDRLHLLIREAVQNAWDARTSEVAPVGFCVRISTFTKEQKKNLTEMFSDLPKGGPTGSQIMNSLGHSELHAIEIADYQTSGLGGPVRADEAPVGDEAADFANYFRNVGSLRDKHFGGGTYGYGKSSAYALSRCSTVLAYTQTTDRGRPVARLMAAGLGDPFVYKRKRFTGRHWWGISARDGVVDPVINEKAHRAAAGIGLQRRSAADRGTTLVVIDPGLESRSLSQAANAVLECLAWFFWPKMLPRPDGEPAMRFAVELNGKALNVPQPSTFPPLTVFADAMRAMKSEAATVIRCERPIKLLGRLGLARGHSKSRMKLDTGDDSIIPVRCSHVALMRPAELVVRYHVGPQLPSDLVEYGGVFICDDAVEPDFASAEPPAHDDWVPDNLEGHSRTFVRVALRRLIEHVDHYANPLPADGQPVPQQSLAVLGDALGGVLIGQQGSRTGSAPQPVGRPASGRKPQLVSVSEPEPFRYAVVRRLPCALFRVRISGQGERKSVFRATPFVVLEGGSAPEAAGFDPPRVMAWLGIGGEQLAQGTDLGIRVAGDITAIVAVSIPGDCAVGVEVKMQDEG